MLDLKVVSVEPLGSRYVLLQLTSDTPLPEMHPGQFAELRVDDSPSTFLRRPISIASRESESPDLVVFCCCHLPALSRGNAHRQIRAKPSHSQALHQHLRVDCTHHSRQEAQFPICAPVIRPIRESSHRSPSIQSFLRETALSARLSPRGYCLIL